MGNSLHCETSCCDSRSELQPDNQPLNGELSGKNGGSSRPSKKNQPVFVSHQIVVPESK